MITANNKTYKLPNLKFFRENVFLPALGFLGVLILWWLVSLLRPELMPNPLETLQACLLYTSPSPRD